MRGINTLRRAKCELLDVEACHDEKCIFFHIVFCKPANARSFEPGPASEETGVPWQRYDRVEIKSCGAGKANLIEIAGVPDDEVMATTRSKF